MCVTVKAYTDPLVGCRVRVIGPGYYKDKCIGHTGTIRAVWSRSNLGVALDDLTNNYSKKGYFYFNISELEIIDTEIIETAPAANKGEKKMQKMTNYLNIAVVNFIDDNDSRTYEYANYTPDLAVGDLCVVMSAHHGMGIARVADIIFATSEADIYREIVAKVDSSAYYNRVASRERAAELKEKMQKRAEQLRDITMYQMLAKEDPAMASLLNEYLALKNEG